MSTSEEVRKELEGLLDSQQELLNLAKDSKDIIKFGTKYQGWYSRAYKLVEALAPERLNEFTSYYLIDPKRKIINAGNYVLQDYIKAIDVSNMDVKTIATIRILNQIQIITSLFSRIDSVLQDVTGHLFAELQDSELRAAVQLIKISKRAAGSLAGVVLERHLQQVAVNHNISIDKKNPTISDLNDPLKSNGIYNTPVWRKIQLLADIRNLCTHQKSVEPTEEQVNELISGTNSVIKSVF